MGLPDRTLLLDGKVVTFDSKSFALYRVVTLRRALRF